MAFQPLTNPLYELQTKLIDEMAKCHYEPLRHVKFAYDWDHGELLGFKGPRKWQADILKLVGEELWKKRKSKNRVVRVVIASGHDIGKTALTAFFQKWAMDTNPDALGQVTANTGNQLKTKTWAELSKWHRLSITKDWFACTATSFYSVQPGHELSWRSNAAIWRESNTEAFQGLHNYTGKRIVIILDEASGIPNSIWDVVEGSCLDEDTEIIVLAFGNPTRNSGRFREIFNGDLDSDQPTIGRKRNGWITLQIDSRTVEGTNKEEMANMIKVHGEDSDFVRTRIKGEFPRASSMQFIPTDWVAEARKRDAKCFPSDPLLMGFDFARGGDDNCVMFFRRGLDSQSIKPIVIPGEEVHDSMKLAAKFAEVFERYKPDAIFGDKTGIGGPILDYLRRQGYNVFEIGFGDKSPDPKYYDMTAYMYSKAKAYLKNGGAIWDDPVMEDELCQREFDYTDDERLYLETKKDMKKRGLMSPDHADAWVLTFAMPIPPKGGNTSVRRHEMQTTMGKYNPLAARQRQR